MRRSPKRSRGLVAAATAAAFSLFAGQASAETLSLAQAIEMGVQKSPSVRSAKAQTDAADARTSIQRARYLPQITASGSAFTGANGNDTVRATNAPPPLPPEFAVREVNYRYGLQGKAQVIWNLWDFGKTSNDVGAADANLDATAANQRETRTNVAGSIAQAYLTLYYQERLLEVATDTLASRDKLAAITRGLVSHRIRPPVDEIRSTSRLEAARRDMERSKAGVEDARTQLAIALGMEPTAPLKLAAPKLPRPALEPAAAVKEAENKRQSLVAAGRSLDARRAQKDAAFSGFLPTLQAVGTATIVTQHADPAQSRVGSQDGSAFLTLTETLDFSSFGNYEQAKANEAAAEADLEATRRDVQSDAMRASIAVRATSAQLDHAKKAEEGSRAVRAIIELTYTNGTASPIELIDAEDADLDARVTRIQTELDYSLAVVRLCIATGRPIAEESAQ